MLKALVTPPALETPLKLGVVGNSMEGDWPSFQAGADFEKKAEMSWVVPEGSERYRTVIGAVELRKNNEPQY